MCKIIDYNSDYGLKFFEEMQARFKMETGDHEVKVKEILDNIKTKGDEALFSYTKEFDGFNLNSHNIKVTEAEIKEAYGQVSESLIGVITRSAKRIRAFHEKQKTSSWFNYDQEGEFLGQMIRPMETAGIYVPGGKAAYPSSVLMNVIPAQVAGVKNIIMVTPPDKNGKISPTTIVAANEAGITEIYKIGGAQAIGALAFGTQTVPKVDKIVGPGNIYVALAKRCVFGFVSIDSIAGPSEILVIADKSANPVFVAADMLSQAEHDEMASAILITDSRDLGEKTLQELKKQTSKLQRKDIIEKSLENYGRIIIVKDLAQAVDLSNHIAPEHLEISTAHPFDILSLIKNAGAIFLGHYTPEPLGDYMAGPNHVLPTGGSARFFSPLSVDDFVKKSSVLSFTKDALSKLSDDIIEFAEAEGLTAHANAVRVRNDE